MTNSEFEKYLKYENYQQPHNILKNILLDKLIIQISLPPDARFLDIGCGRGKMLVKMAERGYKGIGVDLQDISV